MQVYTRYWHIIQFIFYSAQLINDSHFRIDPLQERTGDFPGNMNKDPRIAEEDRREDQTIIVEDMATLEAIAHSIQINSKCIFVLTSQETFIFILTN